MQRLIVACRPMPRPSITSQKEEEIRAALGRDPHASPVARGLGDVSYATVWRVKERAGIDLTTGRAARGNKPGQAERHAKIEEALRAHPEATEEELARRAGSAARRFIRR